MAHSPAAAADNSVNLKGNRDDPYLARLSRRTIDHHRVEILNCNVRDTVLSVWPKKAGAEGEARKDS
jgi:hypothetical protein